jgi:hypothetical protein
MYENDLYSMINSLKKRTKYLIVKIKDQEIHTEDDFYYVIT